MNQAKVTIELFDDVPEGVSLDEVYELLTKALTNAGIENWMWKKTEVFDANGDFLDGDYC